VSTVRHAVYLAAINVSVTDEKPIKIFGLTIDINDLWAVVVAALIVCGTGYLVARKASSGVPSKPQILWELIVGFWSDQVEAMVGPAGRAVVPLAITLFTFILACNWLEVFFWSGHGPSYLPTPTSNVNIDYMMALVVFVVTNAVALRGGVRRYATRFVRPYKALLPLNIIEEVIKPVTLSLRLFGNVFSGALIFALVAGLFATTYLPILPLDFVWLLFDLAIFFIQAFIFALLTVIYYQQAIAVAEGLGH
jgi:F-type H+-transporting ATPase subunit a